MHIFGCLNRYSRFNYFRIFYKKGLEALHFETMPGSEPPAGMSNSLSLTRSLELLKLIAGTHVQISELFRENDTDRYANSISDALDHYKLISGMIQQARKEIYSESDKIRLSEIQQATFNKVTQTAFKAYQITGDVQTSEFAFQNH